MPPAVRRLPEEVALEAEWEAASPALKGMTRTERDGLLKTLEAALEKYRATYTCANADPAEVAGQEAELEVLLRRAQWRKQTATWSKEWWNKEECWVAPWLDSVGTRYVHSLYLAAV